MSRTVVVGDIHGCFTELAELLGVLRLRPDDLLVAAGDVVDRGPSPGEVVNFLRSRPHTVVIMGNHERKHVRGIFSYAQEITRLQLGGHYAATVEWMSTLPYFFENEHIRVVHAAMLPGIPLARQKQEILCGSTSGEKELAAHFPGDYWYHRYTDAKPVAVGHHVVWPSPMILDGRVFGLDTGACHGGRLTALSVPDFTVHSVEARADYWSIVKREWQLPVIKQKEWLDFTWIQLDETVDRFSADPSVRCWLAEVSAWAKGLRAMIPALAAAAQRLAGELTTEQMRTHPVAPALFQARNGRINLDRQCSTPRRTIALAAALDVAIPEPPS
jgi:serine/threonine protein phosphatase 1